MVNFDGQLFESHKVLFPITNRLLKYGDGLFETIHVFEGKVPFLVYHWQRLMEGMAYLGYDPSPSFNLERLIQEINKTIEGSKNEKLRVSIFRKEGGKYLPINDGFHFLIERSALVNNCFVSSAGLRAGFCQNIPLPPFPISQYKTCNALPYILAAKQAKNKGFDEGIILDQEHQAVEATSSNLFIFKDGRFSTPPLSSGCLAGTTRKILIESLGEQLQIRKLYKNDLLEAEELYLSNAIQGIKWIKSLEDCTYTRSQLPFLLSLLNQQIKA